MKLQLITLMAASLIFLVGCGSSSSSNTPPDNTPPIENTKIKVSSDWYVINATVVVGDSSGSTYLGNGTYELNGTYSGTISVTSGVNDVNANEEADTGESYAPALSAPDGYSNANPFTTMIVNGTSVADLEIKYPIAYGIKDDFDFDVVAESTGNIDLQKEIADASLVLSVN